MPNARAILATALYCRCFEPISAPWWASHGSHCMVFNLAGGAWLHSQCMANKPQQYNKPEHSAAYRRNDVQSKALEPLGGPLHNLCRILLLGQVSSRTLLRPLSVEARSPTQWNPPVQPARKCATWFAWMRTYTPTTRRLPSAVLLEMTHRACVLQFTDGARALELEHLPALQFPKQRFEKPVQFAIFMYGTMREVQQPAGYSEDPLIPLRDLPTDITFPGLTQQHQVDQETRRLVARHG